MDTITIADASREAGIDQPTLRTRLRSRGVRPVEVRPTTGNLYPREEALRVARMPLQRGRPKGYTLPSRAQDRSGNCSKCGRRDYGNECREGLCFDCFCHEFCRERGL